MVKIGIDARFYGINFGVGRYLRNLISELQKIDRENDYYIFLLKKDLKVKFSGNFHKVEADFPWYSFKEQMKLPKLLSNYNLDLVHFPQFNIPILYRGKFVVTIHDLIHLDFKMKRASTRNKLYYEIKHRVYRGVVSQALKRSQRVITPSQFVKAELKKRWGVNDSKIVVTPEAVEESFKRAINSISQEKIKKTLDKFGVKPPFIYYIGAAHPHKNIEGLIKAFLELRKNYQYLALVLAGDDDYFWPRIKKEYQGRDIVFTGFVSDEEAAVLLSQSSCYVQPSFNEGFGLPILEAFSAGTPVASSGSAALPEVGGNAAVYFNPKEVSDMVEKISTVLNNQKLRTELIKKGKERVKKFSWGKMADQTHKVYIESS